MGLAYESSAGLLLRVVCVFCGVVSKRTSVGRLSPSKCSATAPAVNTIGRVVDSVKHLERTLISRLLALGQTY